MVVIPDNVDAFSLSKIISINVDIVTVSYRVGINSIPITDPQIRFQKSEGGTCMNCARSTYCIYKVANGRIVAAGNGQWHRKCSSRISSSWHHSIGRCLKVDFEGITSRKSTTINRHCLPRKARANYRSQDIG